MFPRGRLLPIGVLIPTTHIDPGFTGYLRVILANIGMNVIQVPYGYEVARAEFSTLTANIDTPYHGVNAELKTLNPQADELIVRTMSSPQRELAVSDIHQRLLRLERRVHADARRRKRHRFFSIVSILALLASALVALTIFATWKAVSGSAKDIFAQVAAASIVSILAVVFAVTRSRLTALYRKAVSIEEMTGYQEGYSLTIAVLCEEKQPGNGRQHALVLI